MGGRMCSMAVADGLAAAALVLVSYPLHPPGKPDRLRTEHFGALEVPCLFVSGTRDAFGSPAELESATAAIPGPVTHVWIEGGDHGLRGKDSQVAGVVGIGSWLCDRAGFTASAPPDADATRMRRREFGFTASPGRSHPPGRPCHARLPAPDPAPETHRRPDRCRRRTRCS